MTSIYLVRHGEYDDGQVNGQGPTVDLGLSRTGQAQVAALATRLATPTSIKVNALYSSPLPRAIQTAQVISPALGLAAVVEPNLEEWRSDDGNVNPEEFMSTWRSLGDKDRLFHRFVPGCETGIEFSSRVQSTLHRIIKQHAGQSVVLVVHGGVIQVAFQYFFGYGDAAFRRAYPAAGYTSITHWRLEQSSARWVLESSNDMQHLHSAA